MSKRPTCFLSVVSLDSILPVSYVKNAPISTVKFHAIISITEMMLVLDNAVRINILSNILNYIKRIIRIFMSNQSNDITHL